MTTLLEPAAFKAAMRDQWDQSARAWNDNAPLIRAWLHEVTDAMLGMAAIKPGDRVLDVAAGAGDQTLAIAARVGPTGHVLATDLSLGILAFAKQNAERAGYMNVETRVADGEELGVDEASFDSAVCRLGLMFFPAPLRGLRDIHRALKPGGGLCTVVFSTPEKNPCVAISARTALAHAGLGPRDPFEPGGLMSLGKPGLIDALFRDAGFREVATTAIPAPIRLSSARDYVDFIRSSAGPIVQLLNGLDAAAKDAAWADMEQKLAQFTTSAGWEGPNELLLTAGRR